MLVSFTLHTEPRVYPPEFTVTCQTQGGPAELVQWKLNDSPFEFLNKSLFIQYTQSKIILSTTYNAVYDNNIHVRGRISGLYSCFISNSASFIVVHGNETIKGMPIG